MVGPGKRQPLLFSLLRRFFKVKKTHMKCQLLSRLLSINHFEHIMDILILWTCFFTILSLSNHYVDCLQHQLAMDPRLWQLQGQASSRVLGVAAKRGAIFGDVFWAGKMMKKCRLKVYWAWFFWGGWGKMCMFELSFWSFFWMNIGVKCWLYRDYWWVFSLKSSG